MGYNFNWSAVSGGAPYVTLSSLGLAFNSVSIEKLGCPNKIIIGFDEDKCVIGIKAYNNEDNIKAYDFASKQKNGWIRIGCRDFIKYLESLIDIRFSPAIKYVAKYDDSEKILMVFPKEIGKDKEETEEFDFL
ncbi:MAG: hypothetical protein ACRC76_03520 [Proteocatella sp.]